MSDEDVRALCLVRDCGWMTTLPGGPDAWEAANQLLSAHREHQHPNHQLQVQKCPLRGCAWSLPAWSLPGDEYSADRVRLQKEWSKHMAAEHPTVRGPGTIQVTMDLFPYDTPSHDDREIASGALQALPEDGVPIVSARGEIVGRVSELREENGWAVAEGFLREDLINEREAASLWRGETLPVSFAVLPEPHTVQGDRPFYVRSADLRNVRFASDDQPVWAGCGLRATHPRLDAEPEVAEKAPPLGDLDRLALQAAVQNVSASLKPLEDAMRAWAEAVTPAVQALAQALAQHAKAMAVLPEPMVIKVAEPEADFVLGDPPVSRYTCTCGGLPVPHVPGGPQCLQRPPSTRQWDSLYGAVPESPDGPEDWPRLPRNGKRAPTGCEVCEAPVDGRHPRGCPGA